MTVHSIDSLGEDPMLGWTGDAIKQYISDKALAAGDVMIIASWHGGLFEYELATVEEACYGNQKRTRLSSKPLYGGAAFYQSGKNCWTPHRQVRHAPADAAPDGIPEGSW